MIKLILGNITFEGCFKLDEKTKAIVHEISGIINCTNSEEAEKLGEELCNLFDAYLIPEVYKGEIIYECEPEITVYGVQILIDKLAEDKDDSFWYYDQTIAKAILPNGRTFYVESHGMIRVCFEEGGVFYKNQQAVDEAIDRSLTDKDLDSLNSHDGWGNNNWFAIMEFNKDGECIDEHGICHEYDDAIRLFKVVIAEQMGA